VKTSFRVNSPMECSTEQDDCELPSAFAPVARPFVGHRRSQTINTGSYLEGIERWTRCDHLFTLDGIVFIGGIDDNPPAATKVRGLLGSRLFTPFPKLALGFTRQTDVSVPEDYAVCPNFWRLMTRNRRLQQERRSP